MSIRLAMELPTCKLAEWSPLADFDFVLAHKVLEDPEYARFFKYRPKGREVLLDNSYHELGTPLPVKYLHEAAERCNANYVIAPDRVGDVEFNLEQYYIARDALHPDFKTAVVMTGSPNMPWFDGAVEREKFLFEVREADMLCLTFKEPERLAWYSQSTLAHRWQRVHLLGCAELNELQAFQHLSQNDVRSWSMDTGKALKHALCGRKMDKLQSVRFSQSTTEKGEPSEWSQKILELPAERITPEVEELFKHNVRVLRRYM